MSLHHELEARFGLSMEAQVSRAVMGRGLLDRGRAADALACFDRYLASGSGELGEEVMAARATALERLERADDARAAWQRLRETYPTTTYASRVTHAESSSAL
jgi:TolA-binding protein